MSLLLITTRDFVNRACEGWTRAWSEPVMEKIRHPLFGDREVDYARWFEPTETPTTMDLYEGMHRLSRACPLAVDVERLPDVLEEGFQPHDPLFQCVEVDHHHGDIYRYTLDIVTDDRADAAFAQVPEFRPYADRTARRAAGLEVFLLALPD